MHFLALVLFLCGCSSVLGQFGVNTCLGGCVHTVAHWKNASTVWPSTYPESTTICGTSVGVILDTYNFVDCNVSPIFVLGQYIWAKANEAYGACTTVVQTRSAILTLQNVVATANTGVVVGSTPIAFVNACTGGWQNLENLLKTTGVTYTSIAGTLCKFNTGANFGPCPCGPNGLPLTDCRIFRI